MSRLSTLALSVLVLAASACSVRLDAKPVSFVAATVQPVSLREDRDGDGRLLYAEIDTDGDGRADLAYTHRYDAEGRLVESAMDRGADGTFDALRFAEWDAEGQLVEEAFDVDGDGSIDKRVYGPGRDGLADRG